MEQESAATFRLLELVPEDQLGWRPHPKSMSLGQLALHIAQAPGQVSQMAQLDEMEVPKFAQAEAGSLKEIMGTYRAGLETARTGLGGMSDAKLMEQWRLRRGDKIVMAVPRIGIIRTIMLNHSYHHRGQLTVYLRMLNVPLPSVYGPSADYNPF
jgi:uncharacterized damage-inducible protein DinB